MIPPATGPAIAYCAVKRGGGIDIDLLRRSKVSAQAAVKSVHGLLWKQAVAENWHIETVRVTIVGSAEDADTSQERPAPDRQPVMQRASARARMPSPAQEATTAMLRCGR